jgi:hypothetical protein
VGFSSGFAVGRFTAARFTGAEMLENQESQT